MRLFSKRLYHGTPHAFDKFDTEHIGIGEGAQVHGWGLYFAEDKDVADKYRTNLSSYIHQYKIEMNGKEKIVGVDDEDIQLGLKDFSVPESIATAIIRIINFRNQTIHPFVSFKQELVTEISRIKIEMLNNIEKGYATEDVKKWKVYSFSMPLMATSEAIQKFEEMLSWANEHKFDVTSIEGSNKLITVEIPDDLVFAEEDESIKYQPKQVIEALKQIDGDVFKSVEGYKIPRDPPVEENIKSIIKKYIPSDVFIVYALETTIHALNKWHYRNFNTPPEDYLVQGLQSLSPLIPDNNVNWNDLASELLDFANQYKCIKTIYKWDTFEEFYNDYSSVGSPKKTSLKLESLGVNGIHYFGGKDGSCYVIFNPEHLKIINKE